MPNNSNQSKSTSEKKLMSPPTHATQINNNNNNNSNNNNNNNNNKNNSKKQKVEMVWVKEHRKRISEAEAIALGDAAEYITINAFYCRANRVWVKNGTAEKITEQEARTKYYDAEYITKNNLHARKLREEKLWVNKETLEEITEEEAKKLGAKAELMNRLQFQRKLSSARCKQIVATLPNENMVVNQATAKIQTEASNENILQSTVWQQLYEKCQNAWENKDFIVAFNTYKEMQSKIVDVKSKDVGCNIEYAKLTHHLAICLIEDAKSNKKDPGYIVDNLNNVRNYYYNANSFLEDNLTLVKQRSDNPYKAYLTDNEVKAIFELTVFYQKLADYLYSLEFEVDLLNELKEFNLLLRNSIACYTLLLCKREINSNSNNSRDEELIPLHLVLADVNEKIANLLIEKGPTKFAEALEYLEKACEINVQNNKKYSSTDLHLAHLHFYEKIINKSHTENLKKQYAETMQKYIDRYLPNTTQLGIMDKLEINSYLFLSTEILDSSDCNRLQMIATNIIELYKQISENEQYVDEVEKTYTKAKNWLETMNTNPTSQKRKRSSDDEKTVNLNSQINVDDNEISLINKRRAPAINITPSSEENRDLPSKVGYLDEQSNVSKNAETCEPTVSSPINDLGDGIAVTLAQDEVMMNSASQMQVSDEEDSNSNLCLSDIEISVDNVNFYSVYLTKNEAKLFQAALNVKYEANNNNVTVTHHEINPTEMNNEPPHSDLSLNNNNNLVEEDEHPNTNENQHTLIRLTNIKPKMNEIVSDKRAYDPNDPDDRRELEQKYNFKYDSLNLNRNPYKFSIIKIAAIKQLGVRADQDIPFDFKPLFYYAGKRSKRIVNSKSHYIFEIPDKEKKTYEYIDADKVGDISRFFNHQQRNKLFVKQIKHQKKNEICFYAREPIKKDSQIGFNYGSFFDSLDFKPFYLDTTDNEYEDQEKYLQQQNHYHDGIFTFSQNIMQAFALETHQWLVPKLFEFIAANDYDSLADYIKQHPKSIDLLAYSYDEQTQNLMDYPQQQHITSLMFACYLGLEKCIELLIDNNADTNRCTFVSGYMPLSFLLMSNCNKQIKERIGMKLIDKMTHPFIIASDATTLLHNIIMVDSTSLLKSLLSKAVKTQNPILCSMYKNEINAGSAHVDLNHCLLNGKFDLLEILLDAAIKHADLSGGRFKQWLEKGLIFNEESLAQLDNEKSLKLYHLMKRKKYITCLKASISLKAFIHKLEENDNATSKCGYTAKLFKNSSTKMVSQAQTTANLHKKKVVC